MHTSQAKYQKYLNYMYQLTPNSISSRRNNLGQAHNYIYQLTHTRGNTLEWAHRHSYKAVHYLGAYKNKKIGNKSHVQK